MAKLPDVKMITPEEEATAIASLKESQEAAKVGGEPAEYLNIIISTAAAAGKDEITIERDGKKTTIRIKQQDSEGRELLAD